MTRDHFQDGKEEWVRGEQILSFFSLLMFSISNVVSENSLSVCVGVSAIN